MNYHKTFFFELSPCSASAGAYFRLPTPSSYPEKQQIDWHIDIRKIGSGAHAECNHTSTSASFRHLCHQRLFLTHPPRPATEGWLGCVLLVSHAFVVPTAPKILKQRHQKNWHRYLCLLQPHKHQCFLPSLAPPEIIFGPSPQACD